MKKFFNPKLCETCRLRKLLKFDHLVTKCQKCQKRENWRKESIDKVPQYEKFEEEGFAVIFPVKVGDTLYVRAMCDCVITHMDRYTGVVECPFEDSCMYEECCDTNERIFPVTVRSIYNEGMGWYITLKELCCEVEVSDIGRTAFLSWMEAENYIPQTKDEVDQ